MKSIYATHRPVLNAYLVRQRDRRRLRELAMVLALALPLAGSVLAYTWIHLQVLGAGYRIDARERQLHRLVQEERRLRLEASYLASPDRVGRRAAEELGMQAPAIEQMVFAAELAR